MLLAYDDFPGEYIKLLLRIKYRASFFIDAERDDSMSTHVTRLVTQPTTAQNVNIFATLKLKQSNAAVLGRIYSHPSVRTCGGDAGKVGW